MKAPILSVVMPVYNGEKYLKEAIDCVLIQTFEDFELIIIDDGSRDNSAAIIGEYKDVRIRYLKNDRNRGIAYTRNRGLQEARGEYLAWMDCDDLISPDRFELQLDFLEKHPRFGICGTWLTRFDETKSEVAKSPTDPELIKATLLFKPAVWNATAMYRLSWVRAAGLSFDTRLTVAEDYDFYYEASKHFPMANLPLSLYQYRDSESSIMRSFEHEEEKSLAIHKIIYEKALRDMGVNATGQQLQLHRRIGSTYLFETLQDFESAFQWLKYLQKKNDGPGVYDPVVFSRALGNMFFFISKKASQVGVRAFFFYMKKRKDFHTVSNYMVLKLLIRCLIKYRRF
ncbi:glycosyltransferase family 2 protein [Negadavirga shengliensis]|uniref:Glycosyltransferase family 2 protein n=1 Tax=Negadavirga shengliensis TaxID=1389218 RepID=A0ABV9T2E6_9BACT